MKMIRIHPSDNVAVALETVRAGETFEGVTAAQEIPQGHKMALSAIEKETFVVKYGCPIGRVTEDIAPGEWLHVHNVKTTLNDRNLWLIKPRFEPVKELTPEIFMGYRRSDGRAAIRNELWILPTVGCVNSVAQALAKDAQRLVKGSLEGVYAFTHPFGCSQMGDDHAQTRKLLAALARHPNAAGVLVLGLGCENLTMAQFREELGEWDDARVKFLVCQEVEDEHEAGMRLLEALAEEAAKAIREPIPASELVVGMKCGGSDGLSGVTANPTVGRFSDLLIGMGGTTVLTEVPEMFGAETLLFSRCESRDVLKKAIRMVENFKKYFVAHGQVVYENPSPGNKDGGVTTLEDKSCGCVQKGGSAPVADVIGYGDAVTQKGLNLLNGPGNDLVSATALTAAGCHLILFTTGRGTPFGAPAPTIKISTNTALYEKKRGWIDFNAGTVAAGESLDDAGRRLLDCVLKVASGEQTLTERAGFREISIWKDGVVL